MRERSRSEARGPRPAAPRPAAGGGRRTTRPSRSRSVESPPLPLHENPEVYDAAFSWDRANEARTYLEVASHHLGRAVRSAVELASGTGPLARRWASLGVEVYGLDASRAAIRRARTLSRGFVPSSHWIVGDLRDFRCSPPVDLVVLPLDSLGYLVEADDLQSCFLSAFRSLRPGGVFAVDVTLHPARGPPLRIHNRWSVRLRPAGRLDVLWRSWGRAWGEPPRRWEVGTIRVRAPSGRVQTYRDQAPHAILSEGALRGLGTSVAGFRTCTVYSDAAHRAGEAPLRPLRSPRGHLGPHLVVFQKGREG